MSKTVHRGPIKFRQKGRKAPFAMGGGIKSLFRDTEDELLTDLMIAGWDTDQQNEIRQDVQSGDSFMVRMFDIKGNSPLEQTTESKQPIINFSDPEFNGKDSIEFDGSDDVLKRLLTQSEKDRLKQYSKGEVFVVSTVRDTPDTSRIFLSSAYEGSDDESLQWVGWEGDRNDSAGIAEVDGGNTNLLYGDEAMKEKEANVINYRSDGSSYSVELNGTLQSLTLSNGSDTGNWFNHHINGNTNDLENITLGALIRANSVYRPSKIAAAYIYEPLTQGDRDRITNRLMNKYVP